MSSRSQHEAIQEGQNAPSIAYSTLGNTAHRYGIGLDSRKSKFKTQPLVLSMYVADFWQVVFLGLHILFCKVRTILQQIDSISLSRKFCFVFQLIYLFWLR